MKAANEQDTQIDLQTQTSLLVTRKGGWGGGEEGGGGGKEKKGKGVRYMVAHTQCKIQMTYYRTVH